MKKVYSGEELGARGEFLMKEDEEERRSLLKAN
jgi:hypothetical protein